jgi:hypothetical protein
LLGAAIKVTHFGLQQQQQQLGSSSSQLGGVQRVRGKAVAYHRPGKDVVAAPYFHNQEVSNSYGAARQVAQPPLQVKYAMRQVCLLCNERWVCGMLGAECERPDVAEGCTIAFEGCVVPMRV